MTPPASDSDCVASSVGAAAESASASALADAADGANGTNGDNGCLFGFGGGASSSSPSPSSSSGGGGGVAGEEKERDDEAPRSNEPNAADGGTDGTAATAVTAAAADATATATTLASSEAEFFSHLPRFLRLVSVLAGSDDDDDDDDDVASTDEVEGGTMTTETEEDGDEDDDERRLARERRCQQQRRKRKRRGRIAALDEMRGILDGYLEFPTLIDPHLDVIVASRLAAAARRIVRDVFHRDSSSRRRRRRRGPECDGGREEEEPDEGEDREREREREEEHVLACLLSALCQLCRVCGRRKVQRLLPHEASDVEPVLYALTKKKEEHKLCDGGGGGGCEGGEDDDLDDDGPPSWEGSYVLLLWMEMLSLVPFDLRTIDSSSSSSSSSIPTSGGGEGGGGAVTLVRSITDEARSHLTDSGPTREAAARCLASYLVRPDLDGRELDSFVRWSREVLLLSTASTSTTSDDRGGRGRSGGGEVASAAIVDDVDPHREAFRVLGVVQTLAVVFKMAPRRSRLLRCIETLWEPLLLLSPSSPAPSGAGGGGGAGAGAGRGGSGSHLLRKLLVKMFARVGCAYLPPRVAPWRYRRGGRRNLLDNLALSAGGASASQTSTSASASTSTSAVAGHDDETQGGGRRGGEDDRGDEKDDDDEKEDDEVFADVIPSEVLDQLEDVIDQLLNGLRDASSTVVRWSAAKGIGRVTERLPMTCADDVVESVVQLCRDAGGGGGRAGGASANAAVGGASMWHGSCLAQAELARRGLLLPERLGQVVPLVAGAMQYDVRRGQHGSVGSNVRDAACYATWAFARAYDPTVLAPYIPDLCRAVVLTSLFDREVNCRRAASAAFQECVGRQGAQNVRHGIDILTAADYFTLGNRTNAYTDVALSVAKFDEYRTHVIDHVWRDRLRHWDVDVHSLASVALRGLTTLDVPRILSVVLPGLLPLCTSDELCVRHGAVLGVAETVLALGEMGGRDGGGSGDSRNGQHRRSGSSTKHGRDDDATSVFVLDGDNELAKSITELVPTIEKARLYRGRGGEMMRIAVCRLIECISLAGLPLAVRQQVRLLDSVDSSIGHPNEDVQRAAVGGLRALTRQYFPVSATNGPSDRLQKRVVDKYINIINTQDNAAMTRGFSLALGCLPKKLLAPNRCVLTRVLTCLCGISRPDHKVGDEGDAETRRNAITALTEVCETVRIQQGGSIDHRSSTSTSNSSSSDDHHPSCHQPSSPPVVGMAVGMNEDDVSRVFGALLGSMEDYGTDRRGDVGSWSRTAAMLGLERLTYIAVEASPDIPQFTPSGAAEVCPTVPPPSVPAIGDRMAFLESDAPARVKDSFSTGKPFRIHTCVRRRRHNCCQYFDDQLCRKIIGVILKQLCEKLDSVRSLAGECLLRLLRSKDPVVPFVPYREALIEALRLTDILESSVLSTHSADANGGTANIDIGSTPAVTFPLMMRAANIDPYFEDIIAGIVISVGGLTESVVKCSTAALLAWVRALKRLNDTGTIGRLGSLLVKLLERHRREERVVLPLLKTIDKLLSNGYFDDLLKSDNANNFASSLLAMLKVESKGCSSMKRLLAIVSVTLGLLGCRQEGTVRGNILQFVMVMLGHRYPRVRRWTAEQLYIKLIEGVLLPEGSAVSPENQDGVNQMLLEVAWDADLDAPGNVRDARNRVADLMGVQLSESVKNTQSRQQRGPEKSRDEFDSYLSLVKEAGR